MKTRLSVLVMLVVGVWAAVGETLEDVTRLNAAFRRHLQSLGPQHAIAVEIVESSWETYEQESPTSLVPDALGVLYPAYREALAAFDAGDAARAASLMEPLRRHEDPYVAANAEYFHARALVEQGLSEEAERDLAELVADDDTLREHTPYAAHALFLRAHCQAANLHWADAEATLQALTAVFPDAAEPVLLGARQLRIEIERRREGTLDDVADVMGYSAARLGVGDATERVQEQQENVVALLDRLIDEAQQREQQQQQSTGRRDSGQQPEAPRAGAEQSELPGAEAGQIGEQHAAPRVDPGEMWGRLPPAERERILQGLRQRYPSRYRQLVEQYYRSLAEEK
ncbi:MAG: hypothetical protein PVJ57_07615 [Phycisphaerae bacterium]|jgi:TolA-binding protein